MEDFQQGGAHLPVTELRAQAAARFGISGDFMRIAQLAKALGISANSIRAQMRRGAFPIPHRRLGDLVMVKLDDYVEWLTSSPVESRDSEQVLERKPAPDIKAEAATATATARASGVAAESPKQRSSRMKREVLAAAAARRAQHREDPRRDARPRDPRGGSTQTP